MKHKNNNRKKKKKMKEIRDKDEKKEKHFDKEKLKRDSPEREKKKNFIFNVLSVLFSLVVGAAILLVNGDIVASIVSTIVLIVLVFVFGYVRKVLKKASRLKKMEDAFPDFLQLVSSNLRAGITVDKAILLSSRKEFAPLDNEIMLAGKDMTTGKSIEFALTRMAERIKSDKITKIVMLINSGLRSGGNLATLLEQTASSMQEREFVQKRAASNVLMYVIFIFVAAAVGAPALFALSSILVQAMMGMMSSAPGLESTVANINVPFSFSSISISLNFIIYFSLIFIVVTDFLSTLVIGLVSKGSEKEGLKYLIPLLAISLSVFLGIRYFLAGFVSNLF